MCDEVKTLKINGRIRDIDSCIFELVRLLNENGYTTVACCCGHRKRPANIALKDGREITLFKDFETARKIDKLFPPINE